MRSVLRRISRRSTGFGRSVWQAATEYLMWFIKSLEGLRVRKKGAG
jgi:hypothetical protein